MRTNTETGVELATALQSTLGILRTVTRDELAKPTPCAAWDVHALINHFIGTARWWAPMVTGDDAAGAAEDFAAGDFVAAYEESIRIALEAFEAPGTLERTVQLPFGTFSGAEVAGFAATDQFVHGWDLAHALGQDTDLVPDLAESLLSLAKTGAVDSLRGPADDPEVLFGPALDAPADACAADRLAAYFGRRV
ncbi:TIGR03086 family metal-binding protein [Actinospica robiniae]|uniref:TIGR03086 family metal-binding protein n=1 Tax=Actinospica robiniae TaxID=304901 RepID=UPI0003F88F86|nr:TIGR03086 family metal-binding protein [Actinospica robiniae]